MSLFVDVECHVLSLVLPPFACCGQNSGGCGLCSPNKIHSSKCVLPTSLCSESAWDNRAGITASTIDRQMKIYHQFKDHKGEFVGMGRVLNCDPADFRSVKEGDDISCRSSRGFSRTSPLKMRDNDRDSFSAGAPRVVRRQVQTARGPANSETSDLSSQGSAQCKRKVKGEFLKKYTGAGISPFLATAHGLNAPPELLPRGHRNLVSVPVEAGDTYTRVLPAVPPVAQSLDSLAAAQPHMFIPVTIRDRTRRLQPKASEADSSWNNRFHVCPSKNEAKDRVIREYMRY